MGEILSIYQPQPEQLQDAAELFDRAEIEAEAGRLLAEHNRPEVPIELAERTDNSRTALLEALTASGHLSRIELSGNIEDINRQVITRLLNGYDEKLPFRERQRRFYELCNELIIQRTFALITAGKLDPTTAILEMSDFPEGLSGANELGYRESNKKGMVRSTHLRENEDGSYTRIIEQMSRSNSSLHSGYAFLHGAGIYPSGDEPADVLALKTATLYSTNDYVNGVVDIQRRLDQQAGPGIRYGEITRQPLHVDYENVRVISAQREQQLKNFIDRLTEYDAKLDQAEAAGRITAEQRQGLYNEEVRQILRAICVLAPEYAKDCFGERAAVHYEQAARYEQAGDRQMALLELDHAANVEETIVFCGGAITKEEAKKLGLAVDDVGNLVDVGKEGWTWKIGACVVSRCPSPKPTEVGPCSVCRHCQRMFDKGMDPTKTYITAKTAKTVSKPALKAVKLEQEPAKIAA